MPNRLRTQFEGFFRREDKSLLAEVKKEIGLTGQGNTVVSEEEARFSVGAMAASALTGGGECFWITAEMRQVAGLIVRAMAMREDAAGQAVLAAEVRAICDRFPVPGLPAA